MATLSASGGDLFDELGAAALATSGVRDADGDVHMAATAAPRIPATGPNFKDTLSSMALGQFTGLGGGSGKDPEFLEDPAYKGRMRKEGGAINLAFSRHRDATAGPVGMDTSDSERAAPLPPPEAPDAHRRGIFGFTFAESPESRGVAGGDPSSDTTRDVRHDSWMLPGVDHDRGGQQQQRAKRIIASQRHEHEEFGVPIVPFSRKRAAFRAPHASAVAVPAPAAPWKPSPFSLIGAKKRKPMEGAHRHSNDHDHDHAHEHGEQGHEHDHEHDQLQRQTPGAMPWKRRRLPGDVEETKAGPAPARPALAPSSAAAAATAAAATTTAGQPRVAVAEGADRKTSAAELAAAAAAYTAQLQATARSAVLPVLPNNRDLPIVHVGSWANAMADVREMHYENALQEQQANFIFPRWQASFTRFHASAISQGELCERNINKTLNSFGMVRAKHQRQFHEVGIMANMRAIHGSDYERNRIKIMRKKRILELRTEVLCQTPRRYGKTTGVAMLCAALMLNVPGIRIAIFSTGKRASQSLMHLIVTLIHKIPKGDKRIIAKNQEQLLVASTASSVAAVQTKESIKKRALDPSTSVLMSLPGSETGTPENAKG